MLIYIYLFIIIAIFSLLEILTSKRSSQPVFWSLVAILIIFVGFRGENVGFDYESYKSIFEGLNSGDTILVEPAYAALNLILYPFHSFSLVLIVMATFSISLKSLFISKYSKYPITSLVIYFCIALLMYDMGQIRFGMAMSLLLAAYKAMVESKQKWMFIFISLSILFHYSAIIALPAAFLYKREISTKQLYAIILIGCCFYFISINTLFLSISPFMPNHIAAKIHFYTFFTDSYGKDLGVNMSLFLRLAILMLFFKFRKNLYNKFPEAKIFFNLYLYGLFLYMVFNSNSEFATRCGAYFKILELVILPMFISLGKTYFDKIIIWIAIVAYAFYSLGKIIFDPSFGGPYLEYTNTIISTLFL